MFFPFFYVSNIWQTSSPPQGKIFETFSSTRLPLTPGGKRPFEIDYFLYRVITHPPPVHWGRAFELTSKWSSPKTLFARIKPQQTVVKGLKINILKNSGQQMVPRTGRKRTDVVGHGLRDASAGSGARRGSRPAGRRGHVQVFGEQRGRPDQRRHQTRRDRTA